jgi:hypothetical protein
VFLRKLGEKCSLPEGSYRLPTEAQWEYACRAGSTGKWFFGDSETELNDFAWNKGNSEEKTHAVGEKKANAWGLHDVYGNVWEWCADWYDKDYYKASPLKDPAGPVGPPDPKGSPRVRRGGSWGYDGEYCRSARRYYYAPKGRYGNLGLRVLQVLADKPSEQGAPSSPPSPTTTPSKVSDSATAAPAITGHARTQSAVGTPPSSFIGPDGKWKLPPGTSPPAVAPFDAAKAKEHQEAWAKHLAVPVELWHPRNLAEIPVSFENICHCIPQSDYCKASHWIADVRGK